MKKFIFVLAVGLMLQLAQAACMAHGFSEQAAPENWKEDPAEARAAFAALSDLDGKRIGIQTGTIFQPFIEAKLPNAIVTFYNSQSDIISALETGKIDSFPMDELSLPGKRPAPVQ